MQSVSDTASAQVDPSVGSDGAASDNGQGLLDASANTDLNDSSSTDGLGLANALSTGLPQASATPAISPSVSARWLASSTRAGCGSEGGGTDLLLVGHSNRPHRGGFASLVVELRVVGAAGSGDRVPVNSPAPAFGPGDAGSVAALGHELPGPTELGSHQPGDASAGAVRAAAERPTWPVQAATVSRTGPDAMAQATPAPVWNAAPIDSVMLERAIGQFLEPLSHMGEDVANLVESPGLGVWVVAMASSTLTFEVVRRRLWHTRPRDFELDWGIV
jgi:hypothetical protein